MIFASDTAFICKKVCNYLHMSFFFSNFAPDFDLFYTILITKDNFTGLLEKENTTKRYSDDLSFLYSVSDITEYSLSDLDFTFFHLGLKDIFDNFCVNGILFDTFNLEYFSNYSRFYSFSKKREYDLKFYVSLYLQLKEYKKSQNHRMLLNMKKSKRIYFKNRISRAKGV